MSDRRYINPKTGVVTENVAVRPFDEVLKELGEGSTNIELSEALWDLVQRVQDTGKPGQLHLTIAVGFDGAGRVSMKDQMKVKLPEYNRPNTAFYVDGEGNASRRNPDQPVIPGVTDITSKQREAN